MKRNSAASLCAVLILLLPTGSFCAEDALAPGETLFLKGNFTAAAGFFGAVFRDNPEDILAKHLFADCLIISAKDALKAREYAAGIELLKKASAMLPLRKDLKTLFLLAEMEDLYPSGDAGIEPGLLDSRKEMAAVLAYIFTGSTENILPAPEEAERRHLVHVTTDGETLASVAAKYYKDYTKWERIWKANPRLRNPHRLFPGTKLIIPLE